MANAQTFIINGTDLPPPRTASVSRKLSIKKDVSGGLFFGTGDSACYATNDLSLVPTIYVVRFASGNNQGWVERSFAEWLWSQFLNNGTLTITTNITVPSFTNQTFRFAYDEVQSPLTLTKAVSDDSYWMYDMMLKTV